MPRRATRRKAALTARNADRHHLYQRSVQDADAEGRFLARTFERIAGRKALSLREDFCGTALFCARWVAKPNRTAVGLDLDREVLAWGAEHNLAPLGERASSVRLLRQDVRAPCRGRFDVTVALNFSYFVFRTREDLRGYFASAGFRAGAIVYSPWSATAGSTRAARRAGSQHASIATAARPSGTATKVARSVGGTPKSWLARSRAAP